MKKTWIFLTDWMAILLLLSVGPALASDNPFQVKVPFKSAIIHYNFSGHETGESTAYYQGQSTALYKKTTTKFMGMTRNHETVTILTPDRMINVDLAKKKAQATGNPMTYMAEEYDRLSPDKQAQARQNLKNAGQMLTGSLAPGLSETKPGTFLGRKVDVITSQTATVHALPGSSVVLRQEYTVMGLSRGNKEMAGTKTVMEADAFKENVAVPADKFQAPADIEVVFDERADRKLREQTRQWVAFLADPEFEKKMRAFSEGNWDQLESSERRESRDAEVQKDEAQESGAQGGEETQEKSRTESMKEGVGKAAQDSVNKLKKLFKRD